MNISNSNNTETQGGDRSVRNHHRSNRYIAGMLSIWILCFPFSSAVWGGEAQDITGNGKPEGSTEQTAGTHIFRGAVKTNLFYDAVVWTLNLGGEVSVAPNWTIDLSFNCNAWSVNQRKWKHWFIQPEARWWFGGPKTAGGRAFGGHFLPFHVYGGQFNFGNLKNNVHFLGTDWSRLTNERFQGWFFGAGVGYGYSFLIGRHWSVELELGIGYAYTRYDAYPCADCGTKSEEDAVHHYIGPTKMAVNLIYTF